MTETTESNNEQPRTRAVERARHGKGVPLTEDEYAYLYDGDADLVQMSHPCHSACPHVCEDEDCPEYRAETSLATVARKDREERRREIARRYRDRGVLPDDWDVRIAWALMDPDDYYARVKAETRSASSPTRESWFRRLFPSLGTR